MMRIKASDDEDDGEDSDDEFPDLFARPSGDVPTSVPRAARPWETPPTKRRAISGPGPSPLFPKTGIVDMKKLVAQAKQFEKEEALLAQIEEEGIKSEVNEAARPLDEDMKDILLDQDESGKLLLAVKRTGTMTQKRWRFFSTIQDSIPSCSSRPFPEKAAQGRWKILSADEARASRFTSGMVHTLQDCYRDLPDEILAWLLEQLPLEQSTPLRHRYAELVMLMR